MAHGPASAQQLEVGKAGRHRGPSVVLVGYDRTDLGNHALSYAAGLAERTGARLVVLNVNERRRHRRRSSTSRARLRGRM